MNKERSTPRAPIRRKSVKGPVEDSPRLDETNTKVLRKSMLSRRTRAGSGRESTEAL
jgi:hypothetical protein